MPEDAPRIEVPKVPGTPAPPEAAGRMRAVDRTVAVLRAFSMMRPLLSLGEVAALTGLDKNTARRLLLALCAAGMVRRGADGSFGLDIDVLKLQPAVLGPRALRETAAPHLQALAERSGMTAFFWLADPDGAICIERVRAAGLFLDVPWATPGTVVPLNMAGGPRVVLAHLDAPAREAWLARPQPRGTPLTQTGPDELRRAAARIRERGYELILNDYFMGLGGLGVPVLDRRGGFVGALSVTSGAGEFQDTQRVGQILRAARQSAAAIGLRLGPEAGPEAGSAAPGD